MVDVAFEHIENSTIGNAMGVHKGIERGMTVDVKEDFRGNDDSGVNVLDDRIVGEEMRHLA